jgi:hypothetical protein
MDETNTKRLKMGVLIALSFAFTLPSQASLGAATWWNSTYTCSAPIAVTNTVSKTGLVLISSSEAPELIGNMTAGGEGIAFTLSDNSTTVKYTPAWINKTGTSAFIVNFTGDSVLNVWGCNTSVPISYIDYGIPTFWDRTWNSTYWTDADIGTSSSDVVNLGVFKALQQYSNGAEALPRYTDKLGTQWNGATNVSILLGFMVTDRGSHAADREINTEIHNAGGNSGWDIQLISLSGNSAYDMALGVSSNYATWTWADTNFLPPVGQPMFAKVTINPALDTIWLDVFDQTFTHQGSTVAYTSYTETTIQRVRYFQNAYDRTSASSMNTTSLLYAVYDNTTITTSVGDLVFYEAAPSTCWTLTAGLLYIPADVNCVYEVCPGDVGGVFP